MPVVSRERQEWEEKGEGDMETRLTERHRDRQAEIGEGGGKTQERETYR